ncbi:polyamine aminopropyltransferase [Clostridium polynesiense]|uniref:polyamine aminopropyltransferase n=1 Tax=Clostridium polynesiense TaxID=1325933 RepID=UPI00058F77DA|nr:polyamine aminopropyltransferase [Clostridium polynesiense]
MKKYRLLMLTTLIISGCSICYELIISAVSSYLLGDSTLHYSITIGLYMSAMGLGSYVSKYMKDNLFNWFVFIEIGVAIVGGTSALLLFYANLYLETYQIVMYLEIIIIGTFVGAEIPLLTRIIENDNDNLRITLSSIFSFDYIGGLVGSIAFPLLLLPQLGYFATAFFIGCMNAAAAALIIFKYAGRIRQVRIYKFSVVVLFILMAMGMLFSDSISKHVENGLYRDRVILSEHTQYQHIVMTKHKDDLRLYIDGNVQFCSLDEYRYHEALVHIPMAKAEQKDKVLVLGGGDGLAVRELLKYEGTEITLVDLDEQMVSICMENPNITALNKDSLKSDRLTIVNQDAYQFLKETKENFDVIIVDLPDPNNESLNKLYTNTFYRLCYQAMTEEGVMTVQSTSPYYSSKAFWCINDTLESEGFLVHPYHLQVPSFGDWGFNLASKKPLKEETALQVDTKYLTQDNIHSLFIFGKDEMPKEKVEINSLSKPALIQYYSEAIRNWE